MEFKNLNISIKDYIGIIDNGVSVILSVKVDNEFYESLFWYDRANYLLTHSDELESKTSAIDNNEIIDWLKTEVPNFDDIYKQLPVIK